MRRWIPRTIALLAMGMQCWSGNAQASVVITGTRVIFPGDSREVTVRLQNDGKTPALIQAWIDNGDELKAPEKITVPFVLTPAMFRLEPDNGQALRLIYSQEPLPKDKESLFWLNVLEVPPKVADDGTNKIQLAFRSRIKVMFRPKGLAGSTDDAPSQLQWALVRGSGKTQDALKATNPSPYVVNLASVALQAGGKPYDAGAGFVLPGASRTFAIDGIDWPAAQAMTVRYRSIDDWGAIRNEVAAPVVSVGPSEGAVSR